MALQHLKYADIWLKKTLSILRHEVRSENTNFCVSLISLILRLLCEYTSSSHDGITWYVQRSRRGGGGGGGGGGGLFGSRKKAAPAAPAKRPAPSTAPVKQQSAPPAQQQSSGGGMLSGIGSTIAQGMAFGTGSAIAHRAVGAVAESFGGGGDSEGAPADQQQAPQEAQMQNQQLQGACGNDKVMFFDCLKVNQGDQQSCSFLYEQLQSCQRNESQMTFS